MEIYFSTNGVKAAVDYVRKNYPGVTVGLSGAGEETAEQFCRAGNPAHCGEEAFSESTRLFLGFGSARAYSEARLAAADECDYILSVDSDIAAAFSEYSIIGFRKMKYKYPKAVFFSTDSSDDVLGAEAYAYLTRLYAGLVDAGLASMYSPRSVAARSLIGRAKELLLDPGDVEKMIRSGWELAVKAGDTGDFFDFADRFCPDGREGLHHRFLCYYIALMLGIRFTKFPFRSILLGKDEVRARIVMEKHAALGAVGERCRPDPEPMKALAEKYLPDAGELNAVGEGFFPAAGKKAVSPETILGALGAAASLSEGRGFQSLLAGSGFTDAVLDAL